VVFQNFALFPWKTVRQNVLYGIGKRGTKGEEARARAQSFIDMVHLTGSRTVSRRSFPAACSSARRWPARWRPIPISC